MNATGNVNNNEYFVRRIIQIITVKSVVEVSDNNATESFRSSPTKCAWTTAVFNPSRSHSKFHRTTLRAFQAALPQCVQGVYIGQAHNNCLYRLGIGVLVLVVLFVNRQCLGKDGGDHTRKLFSRIERSGRIMGWAVATWKLLRMFLYGKPCKPRLIYLRSLQMK